jgi:predicted ATP-grasp superfamily ATP-dependent carboligase
VRSAEEERAAVAELAAACDGTIVIAPELGNALLERCRWVEAAGGRLLGPGPGIVELASDKHATVEHLTAFGVPAPKGWPIEPGGTIPSGAELPAVGKPCLGAGSQGVRLVADREAADAWAAGLEGPGRLERFCPGVAASVAVLCGPAGIFPLVPCRQRLSNDGRFAYQGGSLPLEVSLAQRATDLAVRSVATLPGAMGYLGVDLVLGSNSEGRDDVVIEINPRLTTSYVGLRAAAAADANLAAAILAVCEGRTPRLSFLPIEVQFEPDGSLL